MCASPLPPSVAEGSPSIHLPGQQLIGVEDDLVVLGEVAHAVVARLIPPVLEVEHTGLDVLEQRGRDQGAGAVLIENAQQAGDGEVAAILSPVNTLDGLIERSLIKRRPAQRLLTELKASDLAEEAGALARRLGSAVIQVHAPAFIERNRWRRPVRCVHMVSP